MQGRFSVNTTRSGDCLRDHFLLAMPGLSEGIFSQSVTYICEHGESGAMGIVINQPLELSVEEIFEHLKIAPHSDFRWRVSRALDRRIPDYQVLTELEGKPLFLPREAHMYPKREAIEWRLAMLHR